MKNRKERGITLIALIITIIVLVILAAVSISVAYKSKVVDYATESSQDYAQESIIENKIMEETTKLLDSTVNRIAGIFNGESIEGGDTPPEDSTKLTKEELAKEEMIGKYVDYKPAGSSYEYRNYYAGTVNSETDKTISTYKPIEGMKWRIWGVEEDKLLLISETVGEPIRLQGENGYNNGVKILNEACSTAYGNNTTYGEGVITARSINQDDIDKVTNMTTNENRKKVNADYGEVFTVSKWPKIYEQELGNIEGGSLDRSNQISWYTGAANSSLEGKYTFYKYNIEDCVRHSMLYTLIRDINSGDEKNFRYWIATRTVERNSRGTVDFGFFCHDYGKVNSLSMLQVDLSSVVQSFLWYTRIMVEINLNHINLSKGLDEGGSEIITLEAR